jgi:hypothetical protein
MTNDKYFAVETYVFPPPVNPGAAATIVTDMMAAQITDLPQCGPSLEKRIIDTFEDLILKALSYEIIGYTNYMSLQFASHLLRYYALIAPTELTQNYECLNMPYDPNQTIETLFQKIQDARAFAVAGGQPYDDAMIVNVAFTLVFNTGQFMMFVVRGRQERYWKNMGVIQALFHFGTLGVLSGKPDCTAIWVPQC